MTEIRRIIFVFACGVGGLFALPAGAEIAVTATLEPAETEVNRVVQYQVTVTANRQGLPHPVLPEIPDVEIVSRGTSQNVSIINGAATFSVIHIFGLVARREGVYPIPPSRIESGGQVYETEAFELKVLAEGQAPPPPPPPRPRDPIEEMFMDPFRARQQPSFHGELRLVPSKTSVYVNEEVELAWKLVFGGNVQAGLQQIEPLKLSGFWAEQPVMIQRPASEGRQTLEGVACDVYTIQRQKVFPISAGAKVIPAGRIVLALQSFLSRGNKALESDPVSLTVKPLPPGQPAGFKGAVGVYTLNAVVDKRKTRQNEAVLLSVSVAGKGNIKTLDGVERPAMESFRLFKETSSVKVDEAAGPVSGRKVYEYVLIPLQSGRLTIPSFSFSYFDPGQRAYKTLKTQPVVLEVEPAAEGEQSVVSYPLTEQKEIRQLSSDIRYIRTVRSLRSGPLLHRTAVPFVFAGIDLILLALAGFLFVREKRMSGDLKLKRRSRAYGRFRRAWKEIERERRTGSVEKVSSLLDKALADYVADRLNVDRSGHVREDLVKRMEGFVGGDLLAGEYVRLADAIEMIKYAPGEGRSAVPVGMDALVEGLRSFVESLESAKETA